MTKQAFSQLRQKIKPTAFIGLNDNYITWFYSDDNFKKYRGYRLLSIDGSITEIPNTACNREHFGYYHNQSDRKQARAMVSVIYDIEKQTVLFDKTMKNIIKNLVPMRPNRSFPRREPSRKNKYPVNKKQSV